MPQENSDPLENRRANCIYRYSGSGAAVLYGVLIAGVIALSAGTALVWRLSETGVLIGDPLILYFVLGGALVGCLFTIRLVYAGSRPISIDCERICALNSNRSRRCIAWTEVSRIVQLRFFDPLLLRNRSSYLIFSSSEKIRFSDEIIDIRTLLRTINELIALHRIRVEIRDSRRRVTAGNRGVEPGESNGVLTL